jgi:transcriptional regulator GlxA family with amidase domain
LSITDAAAALGTECTLLSREFLLDQKITFERFVEREKLYRAAFALEKERYITVRSLSGRLGFATVHDFVKTFEEYFLIDPQRYRLLVRNRARYRQNS